MTSSVRPSLQERMRPNRSQFTIDVYPHVKKFILKMYPKAVTARGTIKVEEYTTLGKLITLALREPSKAENNDQYRDRLSETLTLQLTDKQSKLGPRVHKLLRINIDMDRVFKEHLLSFILNQALNGVAPHTACKMFLRTYGIDENEYSVEVAYRYYQRSKEEAGL